MAIKKLSFEKASEFLEYNPETGMLYKEGKLLIGHIRHDGTLAVNINGMTILTHRLAWLLHHKEWPAGYVTHNNGDKTDNRIENLEERPVYGDIRAVKEIAGVSFVKKTERWKAVIHHKGRQYYLGEYEEKADAVCARHTAEVCLGVKIDHEKSASAWLERNL